MAGFHRYFRDRVKRIAEELDVEGRERREREKAGGGGEGGREKKEERGAYRNTPNLLACTWLK